MNFIPNKDWTADIHEEVQRALVQYRQLMRESGHPYSPIFDRDFDFACANVAGGCISGVVINSYLLLYVISPMWFSPQPVFLEQLLMKLPERGPGNFDEVQDCIATLAREAGCSATVVGNATLRPGLARYYKAKGYVQSNMELIKEIPNG